MKDERLRKMNQEYHEIPIPAELRNRVEAGIREAKKDMATENQTTTATTEKKRKPVKKKNKMIAFVKTAGGARSSPLSSPSQSWPIPAPISPTPWRKSR